MLWVVEALNCQPHCKSKVQSGDSDLMSDEEGQEDDLAHQVWDPCMWGHLHRPRGFSCEASPAGCLQVARSQRFHLVLERLDPNSPGIQQRFQDNSLDWGTGIIGSI
jgi:hypothetical protein